MYAFVENGAVVNTVMSLPKNWRNVSGLNLLKDPEALKRYGWYSVVLDNPVFDPVTQRIKSQSCYYDAEQDKVFQTSEIATIPPKTPEEIQAELDEKRRNMICSNYQARAILLKNGMYDTVQAAMDDATTDPEAKIAWEYAGEFHRISPFVVSMGQALGLTELQLDELFEAAQKVGVVE